MMGSLKRDFKPVLRKLNVPDEEFLAIIQEAATDERKRQKGP